MKAPLKQIALFLLVFCSLQVSSQKLEYFNMDINTLKKAVQYHKTSKSKSGILTMAIDGNKQQLSIVPNELLSKEFQKDYPDIKTYDVYNDNKTAYLGTMTLSNEKASLMLHTSKGYRLFNNEANHQKIKEAQIEPHAISCGVDHHIKKESGMIDYSLTKRKTNILENGTFKRRYKIAIVTTGEFYELNGNSNSTVMATVAASVNGLQAIYEREMSVNFQLLTPFLYTNSGTDPFIPDELGGDGRVPQAISAVSNHFNINQYDIGHVLHQTITDDGWSTGGVAYLQSVCDNGFSTPTKAGGWTGAFNINTLSFFKVFAHEIGHMFGAEHTFNGSGESCDDAISETTAYEIGSGTTIMSYKGICSVDQNIESDAATDEYFHAHSLLQMVNYINDEGDCYTQVTTNNSPPVVDANPCGVNFVIPKSTPFFLTGSATDADGEQLTYTWEQYNEDGPTLATQGYVGNAAANNRFAPIFRSYAPTEDSVRYFPRYADLLNGVFNKFEVLSRVNRQLDFRLTVRDNHPQGGGIGQDGLTIDVSNTGPFTITSPSSNQTLNAGENMTIQWSTGGSDELCDKVDVELSLDGGYTFPFNVAQGIDYQSLSVDYTLPIGINATGNAKIRIRCVDNECFQFFNVSNQYFNIASPCMPNLSSVCDETPIVAEAGDPSLNLSMTSISGETGSQILRTITNSSPNTNLAVRGFNGVGCTTITTSRSSESVILRVSETGDYYFDMDFNYLNKFSFFTLFNESNYNPNSSCGSMIDSGAELAEVGTSSVFTRNRTITLTACTEYRLVFYSYDLNPVTVKMNSITGPGLVYVNDVIDPDYAYTYVAVDSNTGTIRAYSDVSDFTTLSGGVYQVYGMSYKAEGNEPPSYLDLDGIIGKTPEQVVTEGGCFLFSDNYKMMTIESSCLIEDIELGQQELCDPLTNSFSQNVIVLYEMAPTSGTLVVNGQNFGITTSPQLVTLTNLISDGQMLNVEASFSIDPFCKLEKALLIQAPENCCPIDVDLGDQKIACIGESVVLNAGDDGVEYTWKKDGTTLPDQSKQLVVTESGLYSVIVINETDCSKEDEIQVSFLESPTIVPIENQILCEGDSYTFAVNTNGTTVELYKETSLIASDLTNYQISDAGNYRVVSINDAGCETEISFELVTSPLPIVDLGNDVQACQSDEVTLDAGTDGISYQWEIIGEGIISETNASFIAEKSGLYSVTVTNDADCQTIDQVQIDLLEAPTIQFFNTSDTLKYCSISDSDILLNIFQSEVEVTWTLDGVPFSPSESETSHIATQQGMYEISGSNDIGCSATDRIQLVEVETPVVDLGDDIVACIGSEVILTTDVEADSYIWVKAGESMPLSNSNSIQVETNGTYILSTSNDGLCNNLEEIQVEFVPGPTLSLGDDINICEGESASIIATTNGDNIQWFLNNQLITGQTGFDLEVNEGGLYSALVLGQSTCEVRESVMVSILDKPTVSLGGNQNICMNESYTLVADTGVNGDQYEYYLDGNKINVPASTTQIEITEAGEYEVVVTNINNCADSEIMTLTVNPFPTAEIIGVPTLCIGSMQTLQVQSNASSYEWYLNNNVVGNNSANLDIDQSGIYKVIVTSSAGCTFEDQFEVSDVESPVVDLGTDISICPGESAILNAGIHSSYQWSTGENMSTIVVTSPSLGTSTTNTLSVVVTNDADCPGTDDITITYLPTITGNVSQDAAGICPDGSSINLQASGGLYYQWSDPNGELSATDVAEVQASPLETTTYQVTITDDCPDNEDIVNVEVKVFDGANVSAGSDTCIIIGQSYIMNPAGGVSYDWDNEMTIVGSDMIAKAEVEPQETTIYTVEVIDANGCTFIDEVEICVIEDPLSVFQTISIITPNDDGKNDQLVFPGLEAFPDNEIVIFNRWGNIVYEQKGYQVNGELWDGSDSGEKLPADTYYYILTFESHTFKSSITIVYEQ